MSVKSILEGVLDIADERWGRSGGLILGQDEGKSCLLGLIGWSALGPDWRPNYNDFEGREELAEVLEALMPYVGHPGSSPDLRVAYHNDGHFRSPEHVKDFVKSVLADLGE